MTVYNAVAHMLEKIQADTNNIFLSVNERALDDAKAVDEKIRAGTAGRLAGKIIAVKSNICVQGMIVTCASKTLEGWKATYDADVIGMIRKEDGVIIGMTNMDEFGGGSSGEHSAFGATLNPRCPDRIPGGSSSGSCAAVAAGLCHMALGSDTGGSVRNPSAHCGVVGVKPTYGRVSRHGLIDLSMSLDQIGPVAQTVADAGLLLSVIAQRTANDAVMRDDVMGDVLSFTDTPLRVGVVPSLLSMCSDERILEKTMSAISLYETTYGVSSQSIDLQYITLAVQTYYPLVYVEFFSATRKFDGRKYGKKIEDVCGSEMLRRIVGGSLLAQSEHDAQIYKKALSAKRVIERELKKALQSVDIIILPTTPRLPHKFSELVSVADMYAYDAFTIPANLAGICAGVVPWGTIDGVPVGVQVYAGEGKEDVLFCAMRQLEKLASKE